MCILFGSGHDAQLRTTIDHRSLATRKISTSTEKYTRTTCINVPTVRFRPVEPKFKVAKLYYYNFRYSIRWLVTYGFKIYTFNNLSREHNAQHNYSNNKNNILITIIINSVLNQFTRLFK